MTALSLNACAQSQAETIPPTTQEAATAETTISETTVAEILETYGDNTYSGKLSTGDTYTTLNVPDLSTGRLYTEEEAVEIDSFINSWRYKGEKEREELGREYVEYMVGSLAGSSFSEAEVGEIIEYILAEYPLSLTQESSDTPEQSSTKSSESPTKLASEPTTKSASESTKSSESPTQSVVEPEIEETLSPRDQAELDAILNRPLKDSVEVKNPGYIEGDINISGN